MPTTTFYNLSDEKKERILNAAIKEFGERNIYEANLSNIIKDSDISRGSLYQYFLTKEDLYIYVFDTLRAVRAEYVKPAFDLYRKESFMAFFEEFYLRDSEYLLLNPAHIKLGRQLYSNTTGVCKQLINQLQSRYKETFLIAIEYDKDRNYINKDIDSSCLADLCAHFVTDIFIFQMIENQLSMNNIKSHCRKILHILENGIKTQQ